MKTVLKSVQMMALLLLLLVVPATKAQVKAEEQQVKNILLIGSDRRDTSWNGNSDVMILVTINDQTQKIVMTSFMRDLYADIPGHGVHKLNYAYAVSGAELTMATLENNYQLNIDDYATVDFDSMAAIIDILGGVEMTVSDEEANLINGYAASMNYTGEQLPCGGTYVLNGYQAVAHMRDRYVGNYDYERTQRQRDVLTQIFAQVKELNPEQITSLAEEIVSQVNSSMNSFQIMAMVAKFPTMATYSLDENRIPYDGMYSSQGEMLVPDFGATIARLHESLGID